MTESIISRSNYEGHYSSFRTCEIDSNFLKVFVYSEKEIDGIWLKWFFSKNCGEAIEVKKKPGYHYSHIFFREHRSVVKALALDGKNITISAPRFSIVSRISVELPKHMEFVNIKVLVMENVPHSLRKKEVIGNLVKRTIDDGMSGLNQYKYHDSLIGMISSYWPTNKSEFPSQKTMVKTIEIMNDNAIFIEFGHWAFAYCFSKFCDGKRIPIEPVEAKEESPSLKILNKKQKEKEYHTIDLYPVVPKKQKDGGNVIIIKNFPIDELTFHDVKETLRSFGLITSIRRLEINNEPNPKLSDLEVSFVGVSAARSIIRNLFWKFNDGNEPQGIAVEVSDDKVEYFGGIRFVSKSMAKSGSSYDGLLAVCEGWKKSYNKHKYSRKTRANGENIGINSQMYHYGNGYNYNEGNVPVYQENNRYPNENCFFASFGFRYKKFSMIPKLPVLNQHNSFHQHQQQQQQQQNSSGRRSYFTHEYGKIYPQQPPIYHHQQQQNSVVPSFGSQNFNNNVSNFGNNVSPNRYTFAHNNNNNNHNCRQEKVVGGENLSTLISKSKDKTTSNGNHPLDDYNLPNNNLFRFCRK